MRRNSRLVFLIVFGFFCCYHAIAQSKPHYKEVLLDGKPARLNVATGEFTLINPEAKVAIAPIESNSESISDFHVVKSGETLFTLSKLYGVSLNVLKKANNLETTLISIGKKIRVRNFESINSNGNNSDFWMVSKGDTLYSIAKKTNTTVKLLKRLNALKNNTIFIGQKLRLK
ncbi:LysM peptidoglycan-binding domain-containing protein [Algibacter sp. 2305UL17-15]|uniref:LysM peptidoglycan-binding domain-containing protein n=1 Tax=Algibacter sp. 2305UL17-15 TaxID=3231268 RepID=UPI003457D22D